MTRLSAFLERLLDNENRAVDRIEAVMIVLCIFYFIGQCVRTAV